MNSSWLKLFEPLLISLLEIILFETFAFELILSIFLTADFHEKINIKNVNFSIWLIFIFEIIF